ncbi:MAG TPA: DUF2892 domain-containing protein [Steroidobacteraceae bacterium]|nr:DUF2892 domain-containing protein [Steroidobacteraceae bacterium]HRX88339.1 DUF2892 domain-containing protein [Steroidobacteraceae bacterium]
MKINEGTVDRTLRVVVGLAVLALFFVIEGPNRYWALIGIVPVLTGLMGYCPVYALFGLNTCPLKGQKS